MAHDVFISHSSVDKPAADAVCHGLEARGVRCWMAPRDQIAGKAYGQQITEAIRAARVMVLIFSEHVNASQAVLNEIHLAAAAEVTIVPFRIASVELNPELNYYLGRTHWLDAFPQPLDAYIDTLAATVRRNLPDDAPAATLEPAPASAAPPPPPPAPLPPARPNNAPLFVFGGIVALVLLVAIAALMHKPSPAAEKAQGVIAQAVANAIAEGAKEDEHLPPAARDAARQATNDAGGGQ
jgi:TIR domain